MFRTALRLESLESRKVMDGASGAELLSQFGDSPADKGGSGSVEMSREMIQSIASSWGIDPEDSLSSELASIKTISSDGGEEAYSLMIKGRRWDFMMGEQGVELMSSDTKLFHNSDEPTDVNGDGKTTPIDALVIINEINSNGAYMLPNQVEDGVGQKYVDINGDRMVSPIDVLVAINKLNSTSGPSSSEDSEGPAGGGASAGANNSAAPGRSLGDTGGDGEMSDGQDPTNAAPSADGGNDGDAGNGQGDGKDGQGDGQGNGQGDNQGGSDIGDSRGGDGYVDGGLAVNDFLEVALPSSAKTYPTSDIDVLQNDSTSVVEILSVAQAMYGTTEIVKGAGPEGRDVIRYTPGENLRGVDFFIYTVVDAAGKESTAVVRISYTQDNSEFKPFSVTVPSEPVVGEAGKPILFATESGEPLVQVNYKGAQTANVGVFLFWGAPEGPYNGDTFSGELSVSAEVDGATFYPISAGRAWVYGSVDAVNKVLASLKYTPAPGFSAPDGASLAISTTLYSSLGVAVDSSFDSFTVVVPTLAGTPVAVDDVFKIESFVDSVELDVIMNDLFDADDEVEVVSVTPSAYSNATVKIDSETGKVIYQAGSLFGFMGYDVFSYTIRNREGLLSQGRASIQLANT